MARIECVDRSGSRIEGIRPVRFGESPASRIAFAMRLRRMRLGLPAVNRSQTERSGEKR